MNLSPTFTSTVEVVQRKISKLFCSIQSYPSCLHTECNSLHHLQVRNDQCYEGIGQLPSSRKDPLGLPVTISRGGNSCWWSCSCRVKVGVLYYTGQSEHDPFKNHVKTLNPNTTRLLSQLTRYDPRNTINKQVLLGLNKQSSSTQKKQVVLG